MHGNLVPFLLPLGVLAEMVVSYFSRSHVAPTFSVCWNVALIDQQVRMSCHFLILWPEQFIRSHNLFPKYYLHKKCILHTKAGGDRIYRIALYKITGTPEHWILSVTKLFRSSLDITAFLFLRTCLWWLTVCVNFATPWCPVVWSSVSPEVAVTVFCKYDNM